MRPLQPRGCSTKIGQQALPANQPARTALSDPPSHHTREKDAHMFVCLVSAMIYLELVCEQVCSRPNIAWNKLLNIGLLLAEASMQAYHTCSACVKCSSRSGKSWPSSLAKCLRSVVWISSTLQSNCLHPMSTILDLAQGNASLGWPSGASLEILHMMLACVDVHLADNSLLLMPLTVSAANLPNL